MEHQWAVYKLLNDISQDSLRSRSAQVQSSTSSLSTYQGGGVEVYYVQTTCAAPLYFCKTVMMVTVCLYQPWLDKICVILQNTNNLCIL